MKFTKNIFQVWFQGIDHLKSHKKRKKNRWQTDRLVNRNRKG